MDAIHWRYRKQLEDICRDYPDHQDELENRLYLCRKCGWLQDRLYFHITYGDGQVFERPLRCSQCRGPLRYLRHEYAVTKVPCPLCKQRTLKLGLEDLWD